MKVDARFYASYDARHTNERMLGRQPTMSTRKGTTVHLDQHDFEMVEEVAQAQGLSVAKYLARAGRVAALRAQLADYQSDGELTAYYQAADAATAQLWREDT